MPCSHPQSNRRAEPTGPTCPVETLDSPCPPAPAVDARVEVLQEGEVVAATTTDTDGRFELAAPEGTVEVRAESAEGLPSQDVETFTLDDRVAELIKEEECEDLTVVEADPERSAASGN